MNAVFFLIAAAAVGTLLAAASDKNPDGCAVAAILFVVLVIAIGLGMGALLK